MQLFDIHQGSNGPYATGIARNRGSEISSSKLAYLMTQVVALKRKSVRVSPEARLKSLSAERQLRQDLPPLRLQEAYCEGWDQQQLTAEFYERMLYSQDAEEESEQDYDEETMRGRIETDVEKKALFDYEKQFRHRLLEMLENIRFDTGEKLAMAST